MRKKNTSVFIPCTCGASHHLVFTTPEEIYNLKKGERDFLIIYVAFYGSSPFWRRLKQAVSYLFKGEEPIVDDIIVSKRDAEKIKSFINELLKDYKEEE